MRVPRQTGNVPRPMHWPSGQVRPLVYIELTEQVISVIVIVVDGRFIVALKRHKTMHSSYAWHRCASGPEVLHARVSRAGDSFHAGKRAQSNTSANPPRDAAKTVRTTIHRVSVGVLRIKLHVVLALGVWTSICGNTSRFLFNEIIC